jgi:hypothetical protein
VVERNIALKYKKGIAVVNYLKIVRRQVLNAVPTLLISANLIVSILPYVDLGLKFREVILKKKKLHENNK